VIKIESNRFKIWSVILFNVWFLSFAFMGFIERSIHMSVYTVERLSCRQKTITIEGFENCIETSRNIYFSKIRNPSFKQIFVVSPFVAILITVVLKKTNVGKRFEKNIAKGFDSGVSVSEILVANKEDYLRCSNCGKFINENQDSVKDRKDHIEFVCSLCNTKSTIKKEMVDETIG